MPTPFTHLAAAQLLLADDRVSSDIRALLEAERGPFLLGSVAADARPPGSRREDTHFYAYDKPMTEAPWRVMLNRFPALQGSDDAAQRAFVAGYVAHLSMDEIWTTHMLEPRFVRHDWGAARSIRFVLLHALLIHMDERDFARLEAWQHPALAAVRPNGWLPFIDDLTLYEWRDFIAAQIRPGGHSETLAVFGPRINKTADELRALLDSPEQMRPLWDNVPPEMLAEIEIRMYDYARDQMMAYLSSHLTQRSALKPL
ncbi:MAG: hypothetical protein HXY41_09305 [Chloroflexi bacterium]|nr:hypothetical protein [Chloroflexota bacterium]